MFNSILTTTQSTLAPGAILLCLGVALLLGFCIALVYMFRNTYSKHFVITLALLPAMVQVVILMVNGNLGTGIAVLGAFSLVRFRSVPGNAREIGSIFFAMAVGLATGMGYLAFAAVFVAVIGAVMLLFSATSFGEDRGAEKELRITIPENLDYTGLFDDLLARYTTRASLTRVRTTNMGSLYELRYQIRLKDTRQEKAFLDELRCRNGNLTVQCGRVSVNREDL